MNQEEERVRGMIVQILMDPDLKRKDAVHEINKMLTEKKYLHHTPRIVSFGRYVRVVQVEVSVGGGTGTGGSTCRTITTYAEPRPQHKHT